jgi:acyl-CoA synthetase (AMP-forming)/AMP-acid ligase II
VITSEFQINLRRYPDRPIIVCSLGQWTYAEFYNHICRLADRLDELGPGRLCSHLPDSPELIALILAAGMSGRSLALLNHDYTAAQLEPLIQLTEASYLFTDIEYAGKSGCRVLAPDFLRITNLDSQPETFGRKATDSEILIFTSGTTGQPKCARYLWSNLLAQVKKNHTDGEQRWLLAYRLNHFAGIQMIAHVLGNCSTLVLADSTKIVDMIKAMAGHQVTHVSSTPTFWRFSMALLNDWRGKIDLKHITLGSEATSGDLLAQLHALFPNARIVHIYASTEAGSCVSVSDMRPGLPISVLHRAKGSESEFRIVDNELQVKSLHGMSGYLQLDGAQASADTEDGWRKTGDLVRIEGDRIIFIGRKSEVINVGGVKVHPLDVENCVTPLKGVKVVRAYGRKNPIVGQIVAIEVVCNEGYEPVAVEEEIRKACETLVPAARPRSINFVDEILVNNLKLSRQQIERTE